MSSLAAYHPLFHIGAAVSVVALAMRGQLQLRIVLLASLLLYIADEYFYFSSPAWPYIAWNALFVVINAYVTVELLLDRTTIGLSSDKRALYAAFPNLTPGEFRRLLRLAESVETVGVETLTREGEAPAFLYYVIDGTLEIMKGGRRIEVQTPTFIGEIAFRRGGPASATVQLEAGGRLLRWPSRRLAIYLARHAPLNVAFDHLLGDDLARKVARG